ncbi:RCC1 domain-containing protein, partial [Escherichia coli]|uniref:RCC1 domain-containing protein n=1 Tax=Escherichia coli TaxID=562 RepID=UPI00234CDFDD
VYAVGLNNYGQLGTGDLAKKNTPFKLSSSTAKTTIAGEYETYILTDNKEVYVTGSNKSGRLGLGINDAYISELEKVNIPGVKSIVVSNG